MHRTFIRWLGMWFGLGLLLAPQPAQACSTKVPVNFTPTPLAKRLETIPIIVEATVIGTLDSERLITIKVDRYIKGSAADILKVEGFVEREGLCSPVAYLGEHGILYLAPSNKGYVLRSYVILKPEWEESQAVLQLFGLQPLPMPTIITAPTPAPATEIRLNYWLIGVFIVACIMIVVRGKRS